MNHYEQYKLWLNSPSLSESEKEDLRSIAHDDEEIKSRFFSRLEFGTAGLRAIMGVGSFRMNIHVIRHATQALAELVCAEPGDEKKYVAICFDSRCSSDDFAREVASVMAGNGIHVRIFDALRPTPMLSFAIREYGCTAGVNITASHNTKEYNGYKVYWSDGAQLPPRHAQIVAEKMDMLDMFNSYRRMDFDEALKSGIITIMGEETDRLFMENVMALANDYEAVKEVADDFKLVYTPLHGAGYKLVPEALHRLGLKHIICVPEQMELDGTFPTVTSPNPENSESFALGAVLARAHHANLIIATDPDCDRVGIMARNECGEFLTISGNQTGALLFDYLIGAKLRANTMPEKPVVLKTIVTTEMTRRIAEVNNIACFDTFTGFKFMAEKKNDLESNHKGKVIFSYEESYGYMIGDFVRDKDAVTASMLIAEMAAWYAGQNMTLWDALERLYEKYGQYSEYTLNLLMPGLDGITRMRELMAGLRGSPPKGILKTRVMVMRDYESGTEIDVESGTITKMELSGSNVLRYDLEDDTVVIVRPSGTEPKVKVYIMTRSETHIECDEKIKKYTKWAECLA
ncbi:MAG: phospho-sugar mutase [Oscillospiraceae bacterium]|nr:phospho-sugar mutase [Oscillospiraceae bacterium]